MLCSWMDVTSMPLSKDTENLGAGEAGGAEQIKGSGNSEALSCYRASKS